MILRVSPSQKLLTPFAVLVVAQSRKRRLRRGPTFLFFVVFVFGTGGPLPACLCVWEPVTQCLLSSASASSIGTYPFVSYHIPNFSEALGKPLFFEAGGGYIPELWRRASSTHRPLLLANFNDWDDESGASVADVTGT